jgi:hypothetical protein
MLTLQKPRKSLDTLKALAGSGSSGLAKRAQAELRARTEAALRNAVKGGEQ